MSHPELQCGGEGRVIPSVNETMGVNLLTLGPLCLTIQRL